MNQETRTQAKPVQRFNGLRHSPHYYSHEQLHYPTHTHTHTVTKITHTQTVTETSHTPCRFPPPSKMDLDTHTPSPFLQHFTSQTHTHRISHYPPSQSPLHKHTHTHTHAHTRTAHLALHSRGTRLSVSYTYCDIGSAHVHSHHTCLTAVS